MVDPFHPPHLSTYYPHFAFYLMPHCKTVFPYPIWQPWPLRYGQDSGSMVHCGNWDFREGFKGCLAKTGLMGVLICIHHFNENFFGVAR